MAVVALYLGLEMLSNLDGDRAPALALFDHAKRLAVLFEGLGGSGNTAPEGATGKVASEVAQGTAMPEGAS